jgi:TolB-like protein
MKQILGLIFLSFGTILADSLTLRNGKTFDDIKLITQQGDFIVNFPDGRTIKFESSEVKFIKIKPVFWAQDQKNVSKADYDKERIRIAEVFQNSDSKFQPEPGTVPTVAILDLTFSTGIESSVSETLTDTVISTIVSTRLLSVIDRNTLEKALQDSNQNKAQCNINCAGIVGKTIKADKLITGSIRRLGSKYTITLVVNNIQTKSIDFSETQLAQNIEESRDITIELSKKLAGGISEKYSLQFLSQERTPFLPYLARSAILPGWGQYHKEQKLKALGFFGSTFLLGSSIFYLDQQQRKSIQNLNQTNQIANLSLVTGSYNSVSDLYFLQNINSQSNLIDGRKSSIQKLSSLLLLLYLWNLGDAVFSSMQPNLSEGSQNISFIIYNEKNQNTINRKILLGFTFSF